MKTAKDIQRDITDLLRDSVIAEGISGEIYPQGLRPRGSEREDLEVIFTEGAPTEIEEGTITLNIFCPDIPDPEEPASGVRYENARRTYEIEHLLASWFAGLTTADTGGYLLRPASTISTHPLEETKEHFISARIRYRYFDNTTTNS